MKVLFTIFSLVGIGFLSNCQPLNDNCSEAIELCENIIVSGTTREATIEQCLSTDFNGCADDNNSCIAPAASVWYKFTTGSSAGNLVVNISNIVFDLDPNYGQIMQALVVKSPSPCQGANYTSVSECKNNINNATSLVVMNSVNDLEPNTIYYIQVNGVLSGTGVTIPAAVTFDISIGGTALKSIPLSLKSFNSDRTVLCQGDIEDVSFIADGDCSGIPVLEWYFNGSLIAVDNDFSTALLEESGDLYLKMKCGSGACAQEAQTSILFFDITPISANAGPDLLIEKGDSVIIEGSGVGTPTWVPNFDLNLNNVFTPLASPEQGTIYFLTVENGTCVRTDDMQIRVKRGIDIPTAFTPNDDGINDYWEISFIDQYENNQVTIYDRSGQLVYKTIGYNNSSNNWSGLFKGKPVPMSTYFYVIDLRDDEGTVLKGPLTIVR